MSVSGETPRMAEATDRPKKIKGECAILNSFLGAACSMMEIVRDQLAATATRIYWSFAPSVSVTEVVTCITG